MCFTLRSLSARRYRIEGELPSMHDPRFTERLLDRRFEPLSANEERTFGWVTADNCLDSRFAEGSTSRGPCSVFALRIDKRRVNTRLLRAMIDLEMRRRKRAEAAAEGTSIAPEGSRPKAGGRMSRDEKAELKRALSEELLRNTNPTMEVHTVLLYPKEKILLFGSLGKPANETFRALFCETFDVTLTALTPYQRALELLGEHGSEQLASLRHAEFGTPYEASPRAALRGLTAPATRLSTEDASTEEVFQ
jgi:hypothetical protein